MKFLKNIAMAAALSTMLSAGAMAAAPDVLLVANGSPTQSKFALSVEAFERIATKGAIGKSTDLSLDIATRAVNGVVSKVMALDSTTYDDANKVVQLVKDKAANVDTIIDLGAKLKLAGANADTVSAAVTDLENKIIAKLGLKDKDEAAIEAFQKSAEWASIKDYKADNGKTLEELYNDLKTAHGVKVGGQDLSTLSTDIKKFAADVAHQKLVKERDDHAAKVVEHGNTITTHEATIKRLTSELDAEKKAPRTNPLHEKAFNVLAQFETDLAEGGYNATNLPGYVANDSAANIEALFQLATSQGAEIVRLKKLLAEASKTKLATAATSTTTSSSASNDSKTTVTTQPTGLPSLNAGSGANNASGGDANKNEPTNNQKPSSSSSTKNYTPAQIDAAQAQAAANGDEANWESYIDK